MKKHFTATSVVHRRNGDVLMVFHRKLNCWLCPGGHIEENERPDEAALREIYEETGLRAQLISSDAPRIAEDEHASQLCQPMCILEELIPDKETGLHAHLDFVYRAVVEGQPVLNEREAKEIRFFSPEMIAQTPMYENVRSVIQHSFALWLQEN